MKREQVEELLGMVAPDRKEDIFQSIILNLEINHSIVIIIYQSIILTFEIIL